MGDSAVSVGEIIHIVTRRLFEGDARRHFAGRVIAVSDGLVRAEGWVFVFNRGTNEFIRRSMLRTRIFALGDAGNIVNVLPTDVDPANLRYEFSDTGLMITDGIGFSADINEFGPAN
jgi:hypothetical protein